MATMLEISEKGEHLHPNATSNLYRGKMLPLLICRDYHYSRYCNVNRYGIFVSFLVHFLLYSLSPNLVVD